MSGSVERKYGKFSWEIPHMEDLSRENFACLLSTTPGRVRTMIKKGIISPDKYGSKSYYNLRWIPRALFALQVADFEGADGKSNGWDIAKRSVAGFSFNLEQIKNGQVGLEYGDEFGVQYRTEFQRIVEEAVEIYGRQSVRSIGWLPEFSGKQRR